MSDVQARAARVRKHVEDEKLWLCCIETFLAGIRRMKNLLLLPDRLPFWFDLIEWIRFAALAAHLYINQELKKSGKETRIYSWIPCFQISFTW